MAVDFDNVDDVVSLGSDLPFLNGQSGATLMGWARTTRTTGTSQSIVGVSIGPPPGSSSSSRMRLGIDTTLVFLIGRDLDANSPTTVNSSGPGAIVANTWAHVAGTYVNSTRLASLFINGAAAGTGTFTNSSSVNFSATNEKNGRIGAGVDGTANFFDGDIEDARIYSRALSLAEILTIYTSRGRDGITFGLRGRWRMNELGIGATAAVKNSGPIGAQGTTTVSVPVYSSSVLGPRRRVA